MSLEDPLEDHRIAAPGAWTPEDAEARAGELLLRRWPRGGAFIAMSTRKVYLEHEGALLAVARKDIASIGVARFSRLKRMRWGLGFYGLGVLFLLFEPILSLVCVVAGGILVVQGFLSKALVFQLRDARVPPLLVPHAKWRAIGVAIERMK